MRILLEKVFVRVLDPADKCFSKIAKGEPEVRDQKSEVESEVGRAPNRIDTTPRVSSESGIGEFL
jgi:hypothetical protein